MAAQGKKARAPMQQAAPADDPGGRMVRVRSMLENPKGMIDTPKGPRLVELNEEFEIREDMFSPRWMEPLEDINPELSEQRRQRGRAEVRKEVVAGIRRDQDTVRQLYGESDEERLAGLAREVPAPSGAMEL